MFYIGSWSKAVNSIYGDGGYDWFFLFLVFNATFSNISAISWWSVLAVEDSNVDLDLWPNDLKINKVLPLPQGNHVVKFGKDSIYRTKVIVRKPVWTPAIHNHIIRPRLETGTLTLVLYIESLTNLATWFPCRRGRNLFILGSLGQRSRSPLI
jgi:hypothetical protein